MRRLWNICCGWLALTGVLGCSREEGTFSEPEPVMILLEIQNEGFSKTRAANVPQTTEVSVEYLSSLEVRLDATRGGFDWKRVEPETDAEGAPVGRIALYGVVNPIRLELRANGGKASYADLTEEVSYRDYTLPENRDENPANDIVTATTLEDVLPARAPLYGRTEQFGFAEGEVVTDVAGREYRKMTAEVKLAIPIARIEICGIRYGESAASSLFSGLCFSGLYVDRAPVAFEMSYDPVSGTYVQRASCQPPKDWAAASADCAPLRLEISGSGFRSGDVYPASVDGSQQVYAFNIFPQSKGSADGDILPSLKFYFTDAAGVTQTVPAEQYAFITNYLQTGSSQEITVFEPGMIYQIGSLSILDRNLSPVHNPSGRNVVAVVSVREWSVTDTTVDFMR